MATWTDPATLNTGPDDPVTSEFGTAALENPVALAEGAAGAPRVLYDDGSVGSYLFGYSTSGDTALGSTVAGSTLRGTSARRGDDITGGSTPSGSFTTSGTQTGTWRCMGYFDESIGSIGTGIKYGATLWLRIL